MNIGKDAKTLRTKKTQQVYEKYLKSGYDGACIFCRRDLLVKEYIFWILVKNKFPYDATYTNHRMLAPKRHIEEICDLSNEELHEMQLILNELDHNQSILNKKQDRSIPQHFHMQIVNIK